MDMCVGSNNLYRQVNKQGQVYAVEAHTNYVRYHPTENVHLLCHTLLSPALSSTSAMSCTFVRHCPFLHFIPCNFLCPPLTFPALSVDQMVYLQAAVADICWNTSVFVNLATCEVHGVSAQTENCKCLEHPVMSYNNIVIHGLYSALKSSHRIQWHLIFFQLLWSFCATLFQMKYWNSGDVRSLIKILQIFRVLHYCNGLCWFSIKITIKMCKSCKSCKLIVNVFCIFLSPIPDHILIFCHLLCLDVSKILKF